TADGPPGRTQPAGGRRDDLETRSARGAAADGEQHRRHDDAGHEHRTAHHHRLPRVELVFSTVRSRLRRPVAAKIASVPGSLTPTGGSALGTRVDVRLIPRFVDSRDGNRGRPKRTPSFSSTARDVVIALTLLGCTSKKSPLSYIEFVLQRDGERPPFAESERIVAVRGIPGTVDALGDGVVAARDPTSPEKPRARRRTTFHRGV